jgi:cell fate regulator YaaT (PSP1 superfamily)
VLAASDEMRFHRGDVILVRTDRGDVFARALDHSARRTLPPDACSRVVRRLPDAEADVLVARDEQRIAEARKVFIELTRRHRLDMHLSDVEATHGDSRFIFFFTSPGRVDFRNLVRELAGALRSRIELRQVGVRDEARCTGGLGPCGQPLCCATFLREFTAVTIRMAKVQGLVPNPQKVSGLCGRLMCCLAYEHPVYVEMMKGFPKVGAMVVTPKGEGKVKELLVLRNAVKVALGPGMMGEFPLNDVQWKSGGQPAPEPAADEPDDDASLKSLED